MNRTTEMTGSRAELHSFDDLLAENADRLKEHEDGRQYLIAVCWKQLESETPLFSEVFAATKFDTAFRGELAESVFNYFGDEKLTAVENLWEFNVTRIAIILGYFGEL